MAEDDQPGERTNQKATTAAEEQYSAGGHEAADQQYGNDRKKGVMVETVPDKPLPKTGGFPVLFGAGLTLVAATVLGSRVVGRR